MPKTIRNAAPWLRALLAVLLLAALLAAGVFGMRSYRSWLVLRSAHELGAGDLGSIRGWMTLHYIARRYHAPQSALLEQLGLPPETSPETTLRALARQQERSVLDVVQDVQRAVAAVRGNGPAPPSPLAPPRPPAPPPGGGGRP